jgi:hypothetical protein
MLPGSGKRGKALSVDPAVDRDISAFVESWSAVSEPTQLASSSTLAMTRIDTIHGTWPAGSAIFIGSFSWRMN